MNGLEVLEAVEVESINDSWYQSWPDGWRDSHR